MTPVLLQLDGVRFLAACPSHASADAFRYAAGPSAAPPSAAARELDPLLTRLEARGDAGAQAASLAEPLLRRLACLGEQGLSAARALGGALGALADECGPPSPTHGHTRRGDQPREGCPPLPEPPECLTREALEALCLQHTGRDVTRQKLGRRKLAALLPPAALQAAADQALAAQARLEEADVAGAAAGASGFAEGGAVEEPALPSFQGRVRALLDGAERVAAHLEARAPSAAAAERSRARGHRLAAPLARALERLGACGGEAAQQAAPLLRRMARHGDEGLAAARGLAAALTALATGHAALRAEGRALLAPEEAAEERREEEVVRAAGLPGLNPSEIRLDITCNGVRGVLLLPPHFMPKDERVEHQGALLVGSAFEALCGRAQQRKWRQSCRVLQPDGTPGECVGDWMREHVEPSSDGFGRERAARDWRLHLADLLSGARAAADALDEADPGSSEDDEEHFMRKEAKRMKKYRAAVAPRTLGGAADKDVAALAAAAAAAAAATAASAGGAVGWSGLAGMGATVRALQELTLLPLLYPETFAAIGAGAPRGVLLHGPPGTGKTQAVRSLVSAAAALRTPVAFFARRGADCLGKYSGEAERTLRLLFEQAQQAAPSIIFFDELDGLAPARAAGGRGAQDAIHASVVATLLALMDGLHDRGQVVVIGATNRPDAVDAALRRPGRFDRELYFPLPGPKGRGAILKVATQRWGAPPSARLRAALATATEGFAGADLRALTTSAVLRAMRRAAPTLLSGEGASTPAAGGSAQAVPPRDADALLASVQVRPRDWRAALAQAPAPCSRRSATLALQPRTAPLPNHLAPALAATLAKALAALRRMGAKLPACAQAGAAAAMEASAAASEQSAPSLERALARAGLIAPLADDRATLLARAERTAAALEAASDEDEREDDANEEAEAERVSRQSHPSSLHLLLCGVGERGQTAVCGAVLHALGGWAVQSVSLPTLVAEGWGDPTAGAARAVAEPLRQARMGALVLHLPVLDSWAQGGCGCTAAWRSLRAALPTQSHGAPPLLLLATCRVAAAQLPREVRDAFNVVLEVPLPTEQQAAEVLLRAAPWLDAASREALGKAHPDDMMARLLR